MKLNSPTINFKGYAAAPLKAVFLESSTCEPIEKEMKQIAKQEGFEIRYAYDYIKWAQDFKTIIEQGKTPYVIGNCRVDEGFYENIEKMYGIKKLETKTFCTGGNSFIGKYPNGEKWMLVGEDEIRKNKTKKDIAKQYGIKEENIFSVPQQNFHIDMFLRPLEYPYILVDDPKLVERQIDRLERAGHLYDYINLRRNFKYYTQSQQQNWACANETIKALVKAGFKPIRIAGVYNAGINFMNAIVNKHEDGTISYITNSTKCENEFISNIQKAFEEELREKAPNIDKVYFVCGNKDYITYDSNYIMDDLGIRNGGIHCMTLEEPNFSTWI